MSNGRTFARVSIILGLAVLGASVGVCWQALRITSKPQEFRSLAKLVAGGTVVLNDGPTWIEQRQDFYGTIIETLESAELKRRALERVRALNPDLREVDVEIRVAQTKGSTIFNILATGSEPKYTKIFLDALLDEFIAFRQAIREQAQGKVLQQFLQEVVTRQKVMEEAFAHLERVRSKVESADAKAEQARLAARVIRLRDQRDDLRVEIKSLAADAVARAALETKLSPIEQEIQTIEAGLQRHEAAASELRIAVEKHSVAKQAYEKLFEQAEQFQSLFNTTTTGYIAIQERATPAAENVEDWVLPVTVGALGGGLLGAIVGFLLSLILVRPSVPPLPAAG